MSTFKVHIIGSGPFAIDAEVFHNRKRYAIIRLSSRAKTRRQAITSAVNVLRNLKNAVRDLRQYEKDGYP